MPLNWDTTTVEYFKNNPDELWVNDDLNVETKSLVFGTMSIGIGHITEKNYLDFYARWKVLEKMDPSFYLYSTFIDSQKMYHHLTVDVVKKHIGLATNVSYESNTKWSERMSRNRFSKNLTKNQINAYITVFKLEAMEKEVS